MMSPEVAPEFLPVDGFWLLVGFNLQRVQLIDVLQTKPFLGWYIGQLVASFQWSSTNRRHPLAQQNKRMLEVWSAKTLQVCHIAGVMAPAADLTPVACSP
jgi:hypothetical protein